MAEKRNEIHLEDDEHFTSNDILYFVSVKEDINQFSE